MLSRRTGITYNLDDLLNDKVLTNLELIRQECDDIDINYYENNIFQKDFIKDSEFGKKVIKRFIHEFFNGKYDIQYQDFLNKAASNRRFKYKDENSDGYVAAITYLRRIREVMLPDINTYNNTTVYPHEFAHYLNLKYNPKMMDDYLLIEVPSIFLQHMFADYVIKHNYFQEVGDPEVLYTYENIARFLYIPDSSFECLLGLNEDDLSEWEDYDIFIQDIIYYFGCVYANQMRFYYIEDEKRFKKRFINLFQGGKISELLNYYNINMMDDKTVETTLKLVRKIK